MPHENPIEFSPNSNTSRAQDLQGLHFCLHLCFFCRFRDRRCLFDPLTRERRSVLRLFLSRESPPQQLQFITKTKRTVRTGSTTGISTARSPPSSTCPLAAPVAPRSPSTSASDPTPKPRRVFSGLCFPPSMLFPYMNSFIRSTTLASSPHPRGLTLQVNNLQQEFEAKTSTRSRTGASR
jgi:hypothetical protein